MVRDEARFARQTDFARALPAIRERVARDLGRPGSPHDKTLAAVVRLLDETLMRVGNGSYGLTTFQHDHVDIDGPTLRLTFRGKSGKLHELDVRDRRMARIIRRLQDLPGQDHFQDVDREGNTHPIGSEDVNASWPAIAGADFTAKDFRAWAGTVLAARHARQAGPGESDAARQAAIVAGVDAVAARLGNTRAVCRSSCIHPFEEGALHEYTITGRAPRPG